MKHQLEISSRDVLFFSDGRVSKHNHGSNLPAPTTMHSALMSMLYNKFTTMQSFERKHIHKNGYDRNFDKSQMRFGGLKTFGPFLKQGDKIYVPTPADIVSKEIMQPIELLGVSNLPKPLKYGIIGNAKPTKELTLPWIELSSLAEYRQGKGDIETYANDAFYTIEQRPGIEINGETNTTKKGSLFSNSYIRLHDNTTIVVFAECMSFDGERYHDVFEILKNENNDIEFILGGQRGIAQLSIAPLSDEVNNIIFTPASQDSNLVKYTLLTPAYFVNGFLPDFVDIDNGDVLFRVKNSDKKPKNMPRDEWRKSQGEPIKAKLVAVNIGKAQVLSGWKQNIASDGAKATKLLVPAGSSYYFECESEVEREKLIKRLHGATLSGRLADHGLGLGICTTYKYNEF